MKSEDKESLMKSLMQDDNETFTENFIKFNNLVLDENYFDYELLKVALDEVRSCTAKFLISQGCRVRNPNKTNLEETPFHLAMKLEDPDIVTSILNNGASIYDKNLKGYTPLHLAFKVKNEKSVITVLDYIANSDLNLSSNNKDDVLHFHIACIKKHISSVELFISLGFDVNSYLSVGEEEYSGLNPLHYVVSQKDYGDLYEILLRHSDLSVTNSEGLTALHSIFYNCDKGYEFHDEDEDLYYLSNFCQLNYQAFNCENDTKFINAVDRNGLSHFHLCCATNQSKVVQVFIDNGVDINCSLSLNCSYCPGYSPLHFAAKYGGLEVVELLLKNGADCNKLDKNGSTPLHSANEIIESEEDLEITEKLLEYSGSPIVVDRFGRTPIHLTFHNMFHHLSKHGIVLNKLISKIPSNVNLIDKSGLSFLHIVCTRNEPDRVENYLKSGAIIDSLSNSGLFHGYTPLHYAVAFNQKDVVEVLLKRNAQVNIADGPDLKTPLHLACEFDTHKLIELKHKYIYENHKLQSLDWISNREKQLDIIKLLLLHGADIEAKDCSEWTPLLSAYNIEYDFFDFWPSELKNDLINEYHTRIIEVTNILLLNKANINGFNESVFHVICKSELPKVSDDLIKILLNAGVDINAVDSKGLTPLHVATHYSEIELVQCFLKYKANVNIKSKKSKTPLSLAIEKCKNIEPMSTRIEGTDKSAQSCLTILLEHGSDVNVRDSDGRSLLHKAVLASGTFLTEKLLYYGADVNIEDSLGNSIVCSLLVNGVIKRIDVAYIIFLHVQKLLALGLYVNDKVQNFCNYFSQYSKSLMIFNEFESNGTWKVIDLCTKELNILKHFRIDNYTSLYNILLKVPHDLSKHVKNSTLIKILEEVDLDEEFFFYSYLLKLQYKKGLLRRDVLKNAKNSLIYVTNSNLPDSCYDSILRYLTNEEIVKLKLAAGKITKRELDTIKQNLLYICT